MFVSPNDDPNSEKILKLKERLGIENDSVSVHDYLYITRAPFHEYTCGGCVTRGGLMANIINTINSEVNRRVLEEKSKP